MKNATAFLRPLLLLVLLAAFVLGMVVLFRAVSRGVPAMPDANDHPRSPGRYYARTPNGFELSGAACPPHLNSTSCANSRLCAAPATGRC